VPATSIGLALDASGLVTFGTDLAPTTTPVGVRYQRLTHPAGATFVRLVGWCLYRGKAYILALDTSGRVLHYYDGTLVSAFWTGGVYATASPAVACRTFRTRIFIALRDGTVVYSAVNSATDYTGTGSGAIDVFTQSEFMETLTGLSKYQGLLAIFSRRGLQTWQIDSDPTKFALVDAADTNMGTISNSSAVPFGNVDTFLLADTGIRSVRARDNTNRPGIYDLGSPVDPAVLAAMKTLSATELSACPAVIEPIDGRYLIALGSTIFVFSYFPASNISAWSTYAIDGPVSAWVVDGTKLYARVGNTVRLYGGADGTTYDSDLVDVELPYLDGGKPANVKAIEGIDATVDATAGAWTLALGLNPQTPTEREVVARLSRNTFGEMRFAAGGAGTHFGFRLTHQAAGAATIGNLIVHYASDEAD
jgi:hypothetical protein